MTAKRPFLVAPACALTVLASVLASVGCGSSDDGDGLIIGPGTAGTGNAPGSGVGGSAPINPVSMGGAPSGGPPITVGSGGASGGSGGAEPVTACATGMAKANLMPVNMFIQFDRSGSMLDDDKWPQAAQALTAFFQNAETAGLRIALRFFPHDSPAVGCSGDDDGVCSAEACSQPLVPLGEVLATPMDPHEAALVSAVQTSAPPPRPMRGSGQMAPPSQGTPIHPALEGALTWARANQLAKPNEKTVVVLVTDGEPTGCNEDMDAIAGLASTAFMTHGIPTYAVGIAGASEEQMDQIAEAGGTMRAFFAGNASTAQQDLINALNSIRGSVLACDFPVPSAADLPVGTSVDPNKVNINYTSGAGMPETIGRAANEAACAGDSGWFYDNPATPTRITLCPSTCDRVTADGAARIDVLLGCTSIPIPPR
ncbi:MAG TPA: vWA domain-containing protein [Polyangiaceae bacterium]|nr:vWA domain-containing protein [Polyangiaceae bacterium]